MNKKVAIFAFRGEMTCFVHVLLYALDMKRKAYDVRVILEGEATRMAVELAKPDAAFGKLYGQVKEAGLIDAVCQACASQTESLDAAKEQLLPIHNEMSGHPSMTRYMDEGFRIVTM